MVLIDKNLATAVCSTISTLILPYMHELDHYNEIWKVIERRLQATNRSRVIQLKNKLHNVSMKNLSMTQYLTEIKSLVDNIASVEAKIDNEDIIFYTLNDLLSQYQSFKTAIRTQLNSISLEDLYPLLVIEEIKIASDLAMKDNLNQNHSALYHNKGKKLWIGYKNKTKDIDRDQNRDAYKNKIIKIYINIHFLVILMLSIL